MKHMNWKYWLILLLAITTGVAITVSSQKEDKYRDAKALMASMEDSLKVMRNRDSSLTATISVLETENTKQFLSLVSKDLDILNLQELVRQYKAKLKDGGSATILGTDTKIDTKNPTKVSPRDTFVKDSFIYLYPEYASDFNLNGWVTGFVTSNKDSVQVSLSVKNDYSIVIGKESQGLFKKKKTFVEVTSKNPYTQIQTLRTYQVAEPKPNKFGIGIQAGYGLTLNNTPTLTPYIGVGVSYNLIRF
jgi:hypothetical protein